MFDMEMSVPKKSNSKRWPGPQQPWELATCGQDLPRESHPCSASGRLDSAESLGEGMEASGEVQSSTVGVTKGPDEPAGAASSELPELPWAAVGDSLPMGGGLRVPAGSVGAGRWGRPASGAPTKGDYLGFPEFVLNWKWRQQLENCQNSQSDPNPGHTGPTVTGLAELVAGERGWLLHLVPVEKGLASGPGCRTWVRL